MKGTIVAILLVLGAVGGFFPFILGRHTTCGAGFDTREAAERAAAYGRALWFDDVEIEDGPDSRDRRSVWGRDIGVDFRDGETGADAESLRRAFHEIVEREGGRGACWERGAGD